MGRPKLEGIEKMLQKKTKGFSLTRAQYIKMTGEDIPQDKNYTEKRSAVSRLADNNGFSIKVIPEKLIFEKK